MSASTTATDNRDSSSSSSSSSKAANIAKRQLQKGGKLVADDAKSVGAFAQEGLSSGAYIYPIHGVLYLLRNPRLMQGFYPVLYKSAMWSLGITIAMFIFTYLPQVAILFFTGPLAFVAAVPLVLAESYAISMFVVKSMILPGATEKVFDAVLVQKGHKDLVERGRTLKSGSGGNGGTVLGKSLLKPISSKFSTEGLVRYIVTLPLNLIPGVGTAFFLYYNGSKMGPSLHNRYFQLKGLTTSSQRSEFVTARRGAYTSLGMAACALQLVPVVGVVSSFTSAVGAALYAADLERKAGSGGALQEEVGGTDKGRVEMGRGDEL